MPGTIKNAKLSDGELESMKESGTVVVHVMKLYYPKVKNGKIAKGMYWTVVGSLPPNITKAPIKQSIVIITTYNQVQHDVRFEFLGTCKRTDQKPETWVMLCLVVQSSIIPEDQMEYNVAECKLECQKCKNNIVAKTTGHHQSCGSIFGYGSHQVIKTPIHLLVHTKHMNILNILLQSCKSN